MLSRDRRSKRRVLRVVPLVALFAPWRAFAADATAERLYVEGRAAAQAQDWVRACHLFQESQSREPAPGTLLNLANCEEKRGKLVAAAAQYQAAARQFSPGDGRISFALGQAAAIEKRVARLRVQVDGKASVECDGALLDGASLGKSVAVDPGDHVCVVHAPGLLDVRTTLRLAEGESREIDLTGGAAVPRPAPSAATTPTKVERADASPAPASWRAEESRLPAYGLLGLGAVGLGVTVTTGVLALNAAGEVRAACPEGLCASEGNRRAAEESASRARSMALVSTIGLGVGLGAAVAGTYLLVRTRRSAIVAPAVGGNAAGIIVQGKF